MVQSHRNEDYTQTLLTIVHDRKTVIGFKI